MLTKRTILNRNFYTNGGEFKIKQVSISQDETQNKTIVSIEIDGACDFTKNGEFTLRRNLDDGEYFSETFKNIMKVSPRIFKKSLNRYNTLSLNIILTIHERLIFIKKLVDDKNKYLKKQKPDDYPVKKLSIFK
jgi:hypothetical protein